jgi:long-chain acyl-CoA synthetase
VTGDRPSSAGPPYDAALMGTAAEVDVAEDGLLRPDRTAPWPAALPPTVPAALEQAASAEPDRVVLVDGERRYSCRELFAAADAVARALAAVGLGPGDRLAASLRNRAELVVAFFAAMRLRCVWVGVNRALAPPEKARILADCGAAALLADAQVASEEVTTSALSAPGVVLVVEPDGDWPRLLEGSAATLPEPPSGFDPAAIAYTSGTSGLPKGVVHSQRNLVLPAAVAGELGVARDQRIGVCLPLTILNFVILGPISAVVSHGTTVVGTRTDPEGLAAWVRAHRVTTMSAVPTMYHDLATSTIVAREDLASLATAIVGGSACTEELRARFAERFGIRLLAGYGLTEVPTSVARERPDLPHVAGSTGPVLPHVAVEITGESGEVLPPGAEGEIVVRPASAGPWAGTYTTMLGYWGRPEQTRAALAGAVLHTGDVGAFDEAGNLHVRGRQSEVVVRGGAKIHPAEVERVLLEDPGVKGAAVVGVPDERLGEVVGAFVELVPGARTASAELLERCRRSLARAKVPEVLEVLDALPRNAMGKVDKPALRALAAAARGRARRRER